VSSAWDGIIANLEREVAANKAAVLETTTELKELERAHEDRTGTLRRFIDASVDQVAALQSMLDHARRQRDGDPLLAALEPAPDLADAHREEELP
jgi:septal ring factor EnvC (AmiA/AmiB activator)